MNWETIMVELNGQYQVAKKHCSRVWIVNRAYFSHGTFSGWFRATDKEFSSKEKAKTWARIQIDLVRGE